MAAPTIPNGEEHFFPIIYEGNGGGQRVGNFVPFTDNGTIANSVIYNRADTPKLARTPSSDGNKKTFTISFWYKPTDLGTRRVVFAADTSGSDYFYWEFDASNKIELAQYSGPDLRLQTNRTFEDTSKFYHFMLVVDTTQSTASNRLKLYVDGDQVTSFAVETYPSQDLDTKVNSTSYPMAVGSFNSLTSLCTGGYLAEYNFVDGTALTPSTFGLTDTSTGRWIPKTLSGITYGTNGFRLTFADSSAFGDDTSGNTNDFTVANLVAGDQTTDSPTQNFPTIDSNRTALTLSEGNTVGTSPGTGLRFAFSTMTFDPSDSTGYYMEFKLLSATYSVCGFRSDTDPVPLSTSTTYTSDGYIAMNYADDLYQDGTNVYSGPDIYSNNDIIGFYIKERNLYYSINGVMQNSSNPIGTFSKPGRYRITVGHNANYSPYASVQIVCPQSKWTYTPSGDFANYREISQDNAPETAKGVSGLSWIKDRDSASYSHFWYDSTRGQGFSIKSNSTNAQSSYQPNYLKKFLKGGFSVGSNTEINRTTSYASWNWVANGGTTASNSDGSITSTVQANSTAGFSIVKWTGTGSNATVGHGLSTAPSFILGKVLTTTDNWIVGHHKLSSTPWNNAIFLNTYGTLQTSAAYWNNTAPTSSVFTTGTWWYSSQDYIAYCWHEVDGFSKFGKYTGNGVVDGPFVYTGFKPRWLLHKANNGAGWYLYDSVREKNNPLLFPLFPNTTGAESSNVYGFDFLSNGFKLRQPTGYGANYSGVDVYYMAFAEHPFVGDGTSPVTAK